MTRTRTESLILTREQLEKTAKLYAKMQIIGGYYVGEIGDQSVEWLEDGSLRVYTSHTPGEK